MSRGGRAFLVAWFALGSAASAWPSAVEAQDDETVVGGPSVEGSSAEGLSGTVAAHFLASPDNDYGALLDADVTYAIDWLRIGGYFGIGAVPSSVDARNRVFAPIGVSIGAEVIGDPVGFAVHLRGGLFGGATQEEKLTAGGFIGAGVHLLFSIGPTAAIFVGLDVLGVIGNGSTILFSPAVGLSFRPGIPEPERTGREGDALPRSDAEEVDP